jgi:hypothetical protein
VQPARTSHPTTSPLPSGRCAASSNPSTPTRLTMAMSYGGAICRRSCGVSGVRRIDDYSAQLRSTKPEMSGLSRRARRRGRWPHTRRQRECRCFAPSVDDSHDDNDDDSQASRHRHLHDNRTRIVPGRTIGLCLQTRRLGVRISSGAPNQTGVQSSQDSAKSRVTCGIWAVLMISRK